MDYISIAEAKEKGGSTRRHVQVFSVTKVVSPALSAAVRSGQSRRMPRNRQMGVNVNVQTDKPLCIGRKSPFFHFRVQKNTKRSIWPLAFNEEADTWQISLSEQLYQKESRKSGNFYVCQECKIMLH